MGGYIRRLSGEIKETYLRNTEIIANVLEPYLIYHEIPPYDIFPDSNTPKYGRVERKAWEFFWGVTFIGGSAFITLLETPSIIRTARDRDKENL